MDSVLVAVELVIVVGVVPGGVLVVMSYPVDDGTPEYCTGNRRCEKQLEPKGSILLIRQLRWTDAGAVFDHVAHVSRVRVCANTGGKRLGRWHK